MKEPSHGNRRPPAVSNPRPNVIWVFGDQHRAQATGYASDPNVYTPNLDRLATEGTLFSGAVAGCPWCTPFRGSLLTSSYPNHCVRRTPEQMNPDMPTIAEPFRGAGYHTAYFGKWHLDGHQEATGRAAHHHVPRERRGEFGTWMAYENNNSQYDCWVHGHGEDAAEVDLYRLPGYETDCLTDLLLDYVQRRAPSAGSNERGTDDAPQEPFFAILSVQPPHGPYVAPVAYMQRHTPGRVQLRPNVPPMKSLRRQVRQRLAGYCAMIENLDHNVGRIRDLLDETGLADNTYILFFSDHGDMHGSHGYFGKSQPWEESIRIPFIVAGPEPYYVHRSGRNHAVINHVDIAPTTLGLCDIEVPDWMSGYDYSHHCRRDRTASSPEPESALLQHLVCKRAAFDRTWRGIVTRDGWKYICVEHQPLHLFNLNDDPYELVNQAFNHSYRAQRERLQGELDSWLQRTGDSFPLPEL